jgi:hypothetical protein
MSALSSAGLGSLLPATNTAPVDPSREPQSVRNGNPAAKKAYQEGLAFENILVNQLAQEMDNTVPGLSGSDDGLGGTTDGSDPSTGSGGGLASSDSGISAYSSLLPQALTSSVMSGGGTGIAMQIATALDPALANPKVSSQ